jgi:hypothetical protein
MSERAFWRIIRWAVLGNVAVFLYACFTGLREGM